MTNRLLNDILEKNDYSLKNLFSKEIYGYITHGKFQNEHNKILKTSYYFLLPNKVKIKVHSSDGFVYQEGFDGKNAWEMNKFVSGKAYKSLRNGAEFPNPIKSLKDVSISGFKIDYLGLEKLENEKYHKISFMIEPQKFRYYFLDQETYLPVRARDQRPLHPSEKTRNMETLFTNYKKFEGVKMPCRVIERDIDTLEELFILEWIEFEINPKFQEYDFKILQN